ncbi:MAG: elongation factor P [Candidatus Sumerlaeia bacterium]
MQIKALDLRPGSRVEIDGDVYIVTQMEHHAPGKGRAVVRVKMRHVRSGRVLDRTFTSVEKVELADMEFRKMQFLYRESEDFVFMDNDTFEQLHIAGDIVGEAANYLIEGLNVDVSIFKGQPIAIDLPPKVDLRVVSCEPGVKGDTVSNVTKKATLETGATIQVPLFINEGELIRVDTRDGSYVERA